MSNREKTPMNMLVATITKSLSMPFFASPFFYMSKRNLATLCITPEEKNKKVKSLSTSIASDDKNIAILNPKQVEDMLGISHATLYGLIHQGKLRTFTVGRRRCITSEALAEYIIDSEMGEVENG